VSAAIQFKRDYFDFQQHADGSMTCRTHNDNGAPSVAMSCALLSDQQAAYIVHACNAYPKVVKALQDIEMETRPGGQWNPAEHNEVVSRLLRELGETK
jgi:hypothetical protein